MEKKSRKVACQKKMARQSETSVLARTSEEVYHTVNQAAQQHHQIQSSNSENFAWQSSRKQERSWGILETTTNVGLVKGVDSMLKAAKVNLARYEYLGGNRVACCIRGNVSAVGVAVETGLATARQFGEARAAVLANPNPVLSRFLEFPEAIEMIFSCPLCQDMDYGSRAIGLIEAKGFVPLVAALDEMLKAAEITINGCTSAEDQIAVIICGGLAAVEQALDIGVKTVRQVGGEIIATAIVPRPEIQTRIMTTAPRPPASNTYYIDYVSPILALKSGSTARRDKKVRRS